MHFLVYCFQAAAESRASVEPHAVTYVDFLTVTLTAMCVLLAALGFIVAVVAVVGYRDIKTSAMEAAGKAAERALESKLKDYPDASEIHQKYSVMERYMADLVQREKLLSQVRAAPLGVAKPSKEGEDDVVAVKRPKRYPKKVE